MAFFWGSSLGEAISPLGVSPLVFRWPPGSNPSDDVDIIYGNEGNDYLDGGAGNDWLYGGDDADGLYGGNGNDYLSGGYGGDGLSGADGDDTLYGNEDTDYLYGGSGNDILDGGPAFDFMYGEAGNDVYIVDNDDQVTEGLNAGVDQVQSYVNYTLGPNVENLTLLGSAYYGAGNLLDNVIFGNEGFDYLDGGSGNDYLSGESGGDYLSGDDGDDALYGNDDADSLYGGNGNDYLSGGYGGDGLSGDDGDDTLYGNEDTDFLYGGSGNDYLDGGPAADELYGGTGQDRFVIAESGGDFINDFSNLDDTIVLRDVLDGEINNQIVGLDFNPANGVLNSYFAGAGFTGNGTEASGIYNDTSTGNIYYNPTNGDIGDSVVIVNVVGSSSMTNDDFHYSA